MAKKLLDIEEVPSYLSNKVKQDLKFKTGNFVWRVQFNIPLDPKTVNSDTMYVTDAEDHKLQTYIRYDVQKEVIEVEPMEAYAPNNSYHLNITTRVKSRGGQSLREPVKIKFAFADS